jgi:hypothetical protein
MFEINLKRREVIRSLVDAFEGCSAGIRRLDKKIENFGLLVKMKNSPFFLPSLRIPTKQPTNTSTRPLITSRLFSFLPNIKDNG